MACMGARLLEITDLLWPVDADGVPIPVSKGDALDRLKAGRQHRDVRIVSQFPASGEILDPAYIDALGLRVHRELQRLGEELQFGRRVGALLRPLIEAMRRGGVGPLCVVDVGCGLGFVVRAMAASSALGPDVALVGVDLSPVLIAEARRLAGVEGLACRFIQGDAFRPGLAVEDGAACIVISSGLLHHSPESGLADFFAAQSALGVAAFAHWDIAPCLWSTLGAWVFHRARMREAVSRHDGVLSARRAYTGAVLAGFRSSAGRTGLINHRQSDHQAARRGAVLAFVMLTPVIAATSRDIAIHPALMGDYTRAGIVMCAVYGPYALLVLTALACYATLGWRLKYLATALILGPFTLLRPGIAVLGAVLAAVLSKDLVVAIMAGLSVAAGSRRRATRRPALVCTKADWLNRAGCVAAGRSLWQCHGP
jgi:SAM-dependent methyltransferase